MPKEAGLKLLTDPKEPNHVHLVWAVRRLTPVQAKYIGRFYGEDTVEFLKGRPEGTGVG